MLLRASCKNKHHGYCWVKYHYQQTEYSQFCGKPVCLLCNTTALQHNTTGYMFIYDLQRLKEREREEIVNSIMRQLQQLVLKELYYLVFACLREKEESKTESMSNLK